MQTVMQAYFVSKYFAMSLKLESVVLQRPQKSWLDPRTFLYGTISFQFCACFVTVILVYSIEFDKLIQTENKVLVICSFICVVPLFLSVVVFIFEFLKLRRL